MAKKWLNLSAAAEVLGVHPSTVRNWADQGKLPVRRTQGGHRRFLENELELWNKSQSADGPDEAALVVQNALGYTRLQIDEGLLEAEDWYGKLDESARQAYSRRGRDLMRGLINYMGLEEPDATAEAHNQGYHHASLSRRYDLSVYEAMQAFLFFRSVLLESMLNVFETAAVSSPFVWGNMLRKTSAYTDQIMLTLLETYEVFKNSDETRDI